MVGLFTSCFCHYENFGIFPNAHASCSENRDSVYFGHVICWCIFKVVCFAPCSRRNSRIPAASISKWVALGSVNIWVISQTSLFSFTRYFKIIGFSCPYVGNVVLQPLHVCAKRILSLMKQSIISITFFKLTIFCPDLLYVVKNNALEEQECHCY